LPGQRSTEHLPALRKYNFHYTGGLTDHVVSKLDAQLCNLGGITPNDFEVAQSSKFIRAARNNVLDLQFPHLCWLKKINIGTECAKLNFLKKLRLFISPEIVIEKLKIKLHLAICQWKIIRMRTRVV
jgi:hypothetical protein